MKNYMITIGYTRIIVDRVETAMRLLEEGKVVERKNLETKFIYEPIEDFIGLEVVNSEDIRLATKKEEDDKRASDAENSLRWSQESNKKLIKEVEDLKCKLSVLTQDSSDSNIEKD